MQGVVPSVSNVDRIDGNGHLLDESNASSFPASSDEAAASFAGGDEIENSVAETNASSVPGASGDEITSPSESSIDALNASGLVNLSRSWWCWRRPLLCRRWGGRRLLDEPNASSVPASSDEVAA